MNVREEYGHGMKLALFVSQLQVSGLVDFWLVNHLKKIDMGKTERKDGYYWVKFNGMWKIGYYTRGYIFIYWSLVGSDYDYCDSDFSEIGPRIPEYKPKKRKSQTP